MRNAKRFYDFMERPVTKKAAVKTAALKNLCREVIGQSTKSYQRFALII
jgi:hypothetical protein